MREDIERPPRGRGPFFAEARNREGEGFPASSLCRLAVEVSLEAETIRHAGFLTNLVEGRD